MLFQYIRIQLQFITINHNGLKQIYSLVGKKIFETNDKNINVSEL